MKKISNMFGLDWIIYNDYIRQKIMLVDGEELKFRDSDMIFNLVNKRQSNENNPALSLIRFEFMEAMVRLALKRYFET